MSLCTQFMGPTSLISQTHSRWVSFTSQGNGSEVRDMGTFQAEQRLLAPHWRVSFQRMGPFFFISCFPLGQRSKDPVLWASLSQQTDCNPSALLPITPSLVSGPAFIPPSIPFHSFFLSFCWVGLSTFLSDGITSVCHRAWLQKAFSIPSGNALLIES